MSAFLITVVHNCILLEFTFFNRKILLTCLDAYIECNIGYNVPVKETFKFKLQTY
jgi:hypothetical protein